MTGLYLFGPPGVGKTTLMRAFLDPLVPAPAIRLHRALWAEPLIDGDAYAGLLLGRTRGTFSGTDALSMAALPDACGWARAQAPLPVYGEGARLAHPKFADALRDGRNTVRWVLLDGPDDVLGKRRAERGTGQNESWAKGATTTARRTATRLAEEGFRVVTLDATLPVATLVGLLKEATDG